MRPTFYSKVNCEEGSNVQLSTFEAMPAPGWKLTIQMSGCFEPGTTQTGVALLSDRDLVELHRMAAGAVALAGLKGV